MESGNSRLIRSSRTVDRRQRQDKQAPLPAEGSAGAIIRYRRPELGYSPESFFARIGAWQPLEHDRSRITDERRPRRDEREAVRTSAGESREAGVTCRSPTLPAPAGRGLPGREGPDRRASAAHGY
ncbi:hypothetical protein DMP23_09700 [Amycolatopsis sp. A1MSW2902]